jgi:hypothetical protein
MDFLFGQILWWLYVYKPQVKPTTSFAYYSWAVLL